MKNLLLYDGECGLCNAVVRFLLRRDRRAALRFATLQGPVGQEFLRKEGLDTRDFDSLVFIEELDSEAGRVGRYHLRTDAVLEILHRLGGGWRIFRVLRWIPAPVRDLLYRLVARLRYRVFGPYQPRPLERPEWKERFLDGGGVG